MLFFYSFVEVAFLLISEDLLVLILFLLIVLG